MKEFNENESTVIVYTYRYFWKEKSGKICVKFLTEPIEGHNHFIGMLKDNANVVAASREYVSEVNFAYLGFNESLKKENNEEDGEKDEEIS